MARAVIITSYLEYPVDLPGLLRPDDYIVSLDGGYDILRSQGVTPHLLLGDFDSIHADIPEEAGIEILRYPPEKDYTDLELAFRILDPAKTPDLLVIGGLGGRLDQTIVNIQMLARYTAVRDGGTADDSDTGSENNPADDSTDSVPTRSGGPAGDSADSMPACSGSPAGDSTGNVPTYFGGPAGDSTDNVPTRSGGPAGDSNTAPSRDPLYGSHRTYRRIELMDGRNRCFVIHGDGDQCREHRILREHDSYLSLLPMTDACSGVTLSGVRYPLKNASMEKGASLGVSNEFRAEHAVLRLRQGTLLVVIAKMQRTVTDPQQNANA